MQLLKGELLLPIVDSEWIHVHSGHLVHIVYSLIDHKQDSEIFAVSYFCFFSHLSFDEEGSYSFAFLQK